MKTTIKHLYVFDAAKDGVFENLSNYERLVKSIIDRGLTRGEIGSDAYNDYVGGAFEVFAEFFLTRYGMKSNPLLGLLNVEQTSQNKYQVGYDFTATDFDDDPAIIQSKFRSNPEHRFTRTELGTFVSIADEEGIPAKNRVLFTNLEHEPDAVHNGVFDGSYKGGLKQMRVFDRNMQESLIDRDPDFWTDLVTCVSESAKAPEVGKAPDMWEHQVTMNDGCSRIMNLELKRGRIICATGGGKTRVEYETIYDGFFKHDLNLEVMVAPRIDLLIQHHEKFKGWGLFHRDNVVAIHFRTGTEARTDKHADYEQTTKKDELLEALKKYNDRKILIFVTYASEEKLFDTLKDCGITVGLAVWDEFHHTVRQNAAYKDHLKSLAVERNLFFSASEKNGRIMRSLDNELYGPKVADIQYSYLRNKGILVPKLRVKLIRLDPNCKRLVPISREMKKSAERENFDLSDAVFEAASTIVARQDLMDEFGKSNLVTFSKAVPICKVIVDSDAVKAELDTGTTLETVHSDVPGKSRKERYEQVKKSEDSILCQHSILTEGIDLIAFNAAVFSREMEVIGTQQAIGRIVRANPEDTKKFKAGELSLDDPKGWIKYYSTLYVIIHDDEMDNFRKFVLDLAGKLQGAGLSESDWQFADLVEERHGKESNEFDWIVPISGSAVVDQMTLEDYKNNIIVEDEETAKAGESWGNVDAVNLCDHTKLEQVWLSNPILKAKMERIIKEMDSEIR